MHKSWSQNFARPKGRKTRKRTWKSPKRAKSGAFWVLEGMRAVADWCKQMQNPGKLGENNGPDLSRLPPRSALDGRHRRPAPLATLRVPRFRPLPLRKRPELRMQCWSFWQGQKDLNPRHAVLEWMWGNAPESGKWAVLPGSRRKSQNRRCWFGAVSISGKQNRRSP